uniref:Ovule protein n=1 Tax=Strongyloides venezuelensis TaxID=75913 RepID=A0A0K0FPU1_STRVS
MSENAKLIQLNTRSPETIQMTGFVLPDLEGFFFLKLLLSTTLTKTLFLILLLTFCKMEADTIFIAILLIDSVTKLYTQSREP